MAKPTARIIHKSGLAEIVNIDEINHCVEVLVSDGSIDRDLEIILISAWAARLACYMENSVLLWHHPLADPTATPLSLLGVAEWVRVTDKGLMCRFRYAVDENPWARICWDLIAGGFLKAYSVGCRIMAYVTRQSPLADIQALPAYARQALESFECDLVVTDAELFEVTQTFVGSNRSALLKAIAEGKVDRELALKAFGGSLSAPTVDKDKSANQPEACANCGASMERGDDGNCNTCGKPFDTKCVEDDAAKAAKPVQPDDEDGDEADADPDDDDDDDDDPDEEDADEEKNADADDDDDAELAALLAAEPDLLKNLIEAARDAAKARLGLA